MGWGQIIGGGEDGSYTLALDYGAATRDAWIAAIDGWIDRMNVEIANAEGALLAAEDRAATAEAELQGLITTLASAGGTGSSEAPELMAKIDIATARYAQAAAARDAVRIPRDMRIAERKELVKRKNDLQSTALQETKQAWCVDLTEDATGYVATIEIPGENQAVLIAPGGRVPGPADGQLVARELMSPWQVFWNAAVLPGWQKWKPTYRKGTITFLDKDANVANVALDNATSSANSLPVNQTPTLNGISVAYMDCNARAFETGDRVIVAFTGQDWTQPQVIGFVDNPKPCVVVAVVYAVRGGVVFDEYFYPGDTAPGYTAPATLPGIPTEYSGPLDVPFIGWSDGVNTLAHPEIEIEVTPTYRYANAAYASVGLDYRWILTPSIIGTNQQQFSYSSVDNLVTRSGYERSQYDGEVALSSPIDPSGLHNMAAIGGPSQHVGPWFTDWHQTSSATWNSLTDTEPPIPDPTNEQFSSLENTPLITDIVAGAYSVSFTTGGWLVSINYAVAFSTEHFCVTSPTSVTAAPP